MEKNDTQKSILFTKNTNIYLHKALLIDIIIMIDTCDNDSKKINDTETIYEIESKIIDQESCSNEIKIIKKRLLKNIITNRQIKDAISEYAEKSELNRDTFVFSEDLLKCGNVVDNMLSLNFYSIKINIDLSKIIACSIRDGKLDDIYLLMSYGLDVLKIQPYIMYMCSEKNRIALLKKLIDLNQNKDFYFGDDKNLIESLVKNNSNDILDYILEKTDNSMKVFQKIIYMTLKNNNLDILKYYLCQSAFNGAPDIMDEFFYGAIRLGSNIDIIKFFLEHGISLKQNDYKSAKLAIEFNRDYIIDYFCHIDEHVYYLKHNPHDKNDINTKYKLISGKKNCNLYYEDININDGYYICSNNTHYYKQDSWNEFIKSKKRWICPHCLSSVDKILYINNNCKKN